MKINKIATFTTPLCFMPDGRLVCYRLGYVLIMRDEKILQRIQIPITKVEKVFGSFRLFSRLLRFGIRTAEVLDENNIIISLGNMIYELNLDEGRISNGWFCGEGIRPLQFSVVRSIEGFNDGIYFGGYLSNGAKKPVHIYRRISRDKWEIVYTFAKGEINHVHNIVPDLFRQCLWVFTGDFDSAAAIWRISNGFNDINCVASNSQSWRACSVYALSEGLLYATDTPFANNYIYLLNPDSMHLQELAQIDGSCIYSCRYKDKYVFSTTVEGDGRDLSFFKFLFSSKRGVGIKDDYVHMYVGNIDERFKEVYKEKKDILPFYTFQFGVFKFPTGHNVDGKLIFQPVATCKYDSDLMSLEI